MSGNGLARLRTPRIAGVVLGTALLLTGCGQVKAGSAAIVGEDVLTEAQVAEVSEEVNTVVSEADAEVALPPAELNQRIVALWIDEVLTERLAAKQQVEVAAGEVDTFLEQFDEASRLQIASEAGIPPSQIERAAETALLRDKLALALAPDASQEEQTAALFDALKVTSDDLGVSVNPRFGSWDATIPGVGARDDSRLSSLAEGTIEDVPQQPVAP